jgi:hypothetical protein
MEFLQVILYGSLARMKANHANLPAVLQRALDDYATLTDESKKQAIVRLLQQEQEICRAYSLEFEKLARGCLDNNMRTEVMFAVRCGRENAERIGAALQRMGV